MSASGEPEGERRKETGGKRDWQGEKEGGEEQGASFKMRSILEVDIGDERVFGIKVFQRRQYTGALHPSTPPSKALMASV